MTSSNSSEDRLDAALQSLLATDGPDEPPSAVIERVRKQIAERSTRLSATRDGASHIWQQVAWGQLALCLFVMITCGWMAGFHRSLFSRVAGRYISAQGTVTVFYTDGRIKVFANHAP